jgi:hypothetical protein
VTLQETTLKPGRVSAREAGVLRCFSRHLRVGRGIETLVMEERLEPDGIELF